MRMRVGTDTHGEAFPCSLLIRIALSAGDANSLADFPQERSLHMMNYMRRDKSCQHIIRYSVLSAACRRISGWYWVIMSN